MKKIFNNRKGFTLVELLAVIVILAILMVAAGAAVMSTMNNAKVNTFKNEALSAINMATNMYTEISMSADDSGAYLVNSNDSKYKGMCVTLQGLVENGYLDKDLHSGSTYGTIIVEVPFDGGATKYSIWTSDGTYGIQGYEKSQISKLKFKNTNNDVSGIGTYTTSGTGIITKLDGIKKINAAAYSNVTTAANINTATVSNQYQFKANGSVTVGPKLASVQTIAANGGTGATYSNIICINSKIS